MKEKSIIIIGAGLSGLSAGCFAQMNGYDTTIIEKHVKPGGLCTSWSRKGYTIATSGWITGSSEEDPAHQIWKELGVFPDQPILNYEEYVSIEGKNGEKFTIYCDIYMQYFRRFCRYYINLI